MKRYGLICAGMIIVFLALFGVVEALDVPVLSDPREAMSGGGLVAACVGVGLLIADVVLPVPSSWVMVANGALFGAVLGAGLSLLGSLGAAWFGFALGRRGGPLLTRLMSEEERRRGDALLERWGLVAIIATRPVPILAETVVILAGTSAASWGRLTVGTVIGSLPAVSLFAAAGAAGVALDSGLLVFALVLVLAGATWVWGRRLERLA